LVDWKRGAGFEAGSRFFVGFFAGNVAEAAPQKAGVSVLERRQTGWRRWGDGAILQLP
jgi:hypothetical protein